MRGYPFTCDSCGRVGTEDDLCVAGEPCPDEECDGIVRFVCPHDRIMLVETGYEREWEWADLGNGRFSATEDYPASVGDEGDGGYRLRCKSCLAEFPMPDEYEIDFQ